jgi:hypothetical protein
VGSPFGKLRILKVDFDYGRKAKFKMKTNKTISFKEKQFSKNIFKLLNETIKTEKHPNTKTYLKFAKHVSPIEAHYYSLCYEYVQKMKIEIFSYSDDRFKIIKRKKFREIRGYLWELWGELYTVIFEVSKKNTSYSFNHLFFEYFILEGFVEQNMDSLNIGPETKKQELKFIKLSNAFKKAGFKKDVCKKIELAFVQIYGLCEIYSKNYLDFIKNNNSLILHRKFRELNFAAHCFVGYYSKWYPLLFFITRDKKYIHAFKD